MNCKRFSQLHFVALLIILNVSSCVSVQSSRVNITSVRNCDYDPSESLEHVVRLSDIRYDINADGLCDVIHGKYEMPSVNLGDKLMNISMYRCNAQSTGVCNENVEHFYEVLHCERFRNDNTGPWYMFSAAMSGSHCGEALGVFELNNAQLKMEYIPKYMREDVDFPRHRMVKMMRKIVDGSVFTVLRACIEVEWTMIF